MSSVIISHFLLDLRSIHSSSSVNDQVSTVRFSSSIVANLGASLYASSQARYHLGGGEEKTLYSDRPLHVGLLDDGILCVIMIPRIF